MHRQRYHTEEVLKETCGALWGVSDTIYVDHRPTAEPKQVQDFLVVSIPTQMTERNVYQKGTVRIEIGVRDKASGVPDVARLETLLDGVAGKFPVVGGRFTVTKPRLTLKGRDGLGFTLWMVQASLCIKTLDSYYY